MKLNMENEKHPIKRRGILVNKETIDQMQRSMADGKIWLTVNIPKTQTGRTDEQNQNKTWHDYVKPIDPTVQTNYLKPSEIMYGKKVFVHTVNDPTFFRPIGTIISHINLVFPYESITRENADAFVCDDEMCELCHSQHTKGVFTANEFIGCFMQCNTL
jgi:hypothetical protein